MMQRHYYNRRQTRNAFKRVVYGARNAISNIASTRNNLAVAAGASAYALAGGKASFRNKDKIKTKPKLNQKATPEGTGGFTSMYYYTPRKMPRAYAVLNKSLPKNYYVTNNSGRLVQTPGLQAIYCMSIANKTDINLISQKINTSQVNRFLMQQCSSEFVFTNQDAGNCRVWLYDIVARRDLATNANLVTPQAAFQNSLADEGGANANWSIPGTTPFSSDLFTQYFKVCKITNIVMAQGQSHTHKVSFKTNKVMDGEYIQYEGNGFKGLSHYVMMVVHGFPYNDSTTKTQVSTGNVAIDFITKVQYKYTWIQDVDTNYSVSNTLPTAFTVSEDIMDIGTGAIAVDTQA
nr:MAG: capsid protein [Cressdnaviricota sp.]